MPYNFTIPLSLLRLAGLILGFIVIRFLWQFLAPKGKVSEAIWGAVGLIFVLVIVVDAVNRGPISAWVVAQIGQLMADPKKYLDNLALVLLAAIIAQILWGMIFGQQDWVEGILKMVGVFIVWILYKSLQSNSSKIYLAIEGFIASLISSLLGG